MKMSFWQIFNTGYVEVVKLTSSNKASDEYFVKLPHFYFSDEYLGNFILD